MTVIIDLYFSFRSPYSYLSTPGALDVVKKYDVDIRLKPVLPLALRVPDFFNAANMKKIQYILLDWTRRAEMLGLPHAWPSPDPIVQELTELKIADEQPYIYRLIYLGIEAERSGHGLPFAAEVSKMIFGGTKDWDQGDHMAKAAERVGLNLAQMEEAIADPASHKAELEDNMKAQDKCGHYGVPTFVYNHEPYFGQDRIDSLCFQLDKDNLKRG